MRRRGGYDSDEYDEGSRRRSHRSRSREVSALVVSATLSVRVSRPRERGLLLTLLFKFSFYRGVAATNTIHTTTQEAAGTCAAPAATGGAGTIWTAPVSLRRG